MPTSRNNHYVPQWYQEGFFEPGRNTLARLDLSPEQHRLPNGKTVPGRAVFDSPTSRCFSQMDLYSTFFRSIVNNEIIVNDEIERMLFGAIDTAAAPAVRAFESDDPNEWMRHFETLFRYLDIQKIRTPKGLDWVRAQHPKLSQNELMEEMQGIQMMNCTIWTEGVREIVSAEDAEVKFVTTDHPVTVYNPAMPPNSRKPEDYVEPSIKLKGSQTLFPMNRNQCLILTNLEFARDPTENPIQRRTFARNYRSSMVRTDAFIRSRRLTSDEVTQINAILKAGARRYVAAGRKEWLYPDQQAPARWKDLGAVLRPPENDLHLFGGEIMAKFNDGTVRFQDEFGRAEKPNPALLKSPVPTPKAKDPCGCGSDRPFRICCEPRPAHLRPSWAERSIRERNLILYRAILDILGMKDGKDWNAIRRELNDEQIAKIYTVYASLWVPETDLLALLPKPDGRPRAVYTGSIHPSLINEFAVGAALYFGEVLIEHPFVNARAVRKEFSPVENPQIYRQEILKSLVLFFTLIPLVAAGLVNLIPDPGNFDLHLRDQVMAMAKERSADVKFDLKREERIVKVMEEDARRGLLQIPPAALQAQLDKGIPGLENASLREVQEAIATLKLQDPLAILQPDAMAPGEEGGLLTMSKLAPNYEMAMYLAQATGGVIITDSAHRWAEVALNLRRRAALPIRGLSVLSERVEQAQFALPQDEMQVLDLACSDILADYPPLIAAASKYLRVQERAGSKPNFEARLAAQFAQLHAPAQARLHKSGADLTVGHFRIATPVGGILDRTVNRLLLMSSAEHHFQSVPMAIYFELEKLGNK